MAKVCEVCGKQKMFGNNICFSHKSSKRSWSPNIRRVKAIVNGAPKRINVCAKCLKSNKVERAI
ncbi:50S ribosomal protein L28 [Peptoniphilus sp. GNH]|nr:ribosomal protein L28 [Clostridiales bacterium KA00134]UHR02990.1 50S ribosomal protein L28 [Peptoniphilus sp. GNH]